MKITPAVLALPIPEKIRIGRSSFNDDVWDMTPIIHYPERMQKFKRQLNFKSFSNNKICKVVKLYAYHELGCVKPLTVSSKIQSLTVFSQYCSIKGIQSFQDITKEIVLDYSMWLKADKGFAHNRGYCCCYSLIELLRIGQIKGWDVPAANILTGVKACDLWSSYSNNSNGIKPIPKDVFDKILWFAIHREHDVLTKAGIIIQSQTGLRISEVLSICEGCVKPVDEKHFYLEVTLAKTVKGKPVMHSVLVNDLVVKAVLELEDHTVRLRKISKLKELFVYRYHTIRVCAASSWSQLHLRSFIRRWDIRDNHGDLYHLCSHQFRASYVADLVKKEIPISYIMKQFAHVSIEMTAHYLTLKQEEIKKIYSKMIFSPDSSIVGFKAHEIKTRINKEFKGKTAEEIETIISGLYDTMSFNPLPTGICLYDFRRGNCSNGDGCFFYNCPNFITGIKFYPVLKQELELIEKEMDRLKMLGRDRDWQRQYVKHKYLKPLVKKMEGMLNENE